MRDEKNKYMSGDCRSGSALSLGSSGGVKHALQLEYQLCGCEVYGT